MLLYILPQCLPYSSCWLTGGQIGLKIVLSLPPPSKQPLPKEGRKLMVIVQTEHMPGPSLKLHRPFSTL